MRNTRIVLWSLVAVALLGLGALTLADLLPRGAGNVQAGTDLTPGEPLGGAFTLVDQDNAPLTEAVFRGKPSAVLFGFTHCPDVCPTALMEMSGWIEALGPDADRLRFVFVTVDPERDDPAAMDAYLGAFSDRIIGVTGEPEKVQSVLRDYNIPFSKVPLEGGYYSMDHLASVVLLDAGGSMVGTISREEGRDAAVAKLKALVAG